MRLRARARHRSTRCRGLTLRSAAVREALCRQDLFLVLNILEYTPPLPPLSKYQTFLHPK